MDSQATTYESSFKRGRSRSRSRSRAGSRSRAAASSRPYFPRLRGVKGDAVYRFSRKTAKTFVLNNLNGISSSTADFGMGITYYMEGCSFNGQATSCTIPSTSEFRALFDLWRIECVDVKIYFQSMVTTNSTATLPYGNPVLLIAHDYQDGTRPSSGDVLRQVSGNYSTQICGTGGHKFRVYPKPQQSTYQSGTFSGYSVNQSSNLWLSTDYPLIEHYATKIWWEKIPSSATDISIGNLHFEFNFHFAFKGVA